jgi:hypothetical protein
MRHVFLEDQLNILIGLSAAALVFSSSLSAGVILTDNLSEPSDGSNTMSNIRYLAIDFRTDNNAYQLDTVTLLVAQDAGTTGPLVQLFSDAGQPGTLLATLNGPAAFPATLTDEDFTSPGLLLSPNTTYWIVAQTASGTAYWSDPTTSVGTGVGFLGQWAFLDSPPAPWTVLPVGDQPFQAEVTADVVPEPSTFALLAVPFLVLGALMTQIRREKSRKA